jgi:hypothetical protein
MSDGYNGWTNYETWRCNLELLDGMDWSDHLNELMDEENSHDMIVSNIAGQMETLVEEIIYQGVKNPLVESLVHDFIRKVNFEEIASHVVNDYMYEQLTT